MPFFNGCRRTEQHKILHHLPDRDPALVCVNNAAEISALA
jgi:hypothetical protein